MLDVGRILLDGGALAVVTMVFLVGVLRYNPRLFLNKGDVPADILEAVPPKTPKEKRLAALLGVPFILLAFVLPLLSTIAFDARSGSEASFGVLFAHALGVLSVPFFADLFILDWLLFCTITPSWAVIEGTEGFAGYKDYGFHLRAHTRGAVWMFVFALLIAGLAVAVGPAEASREPALAGGTAGASRQQISPHALRQRHASIPVPVEEVFAPVFIYTPATNGGGLFTEPDGRTVRLFYRLGPGNENSGRTLYEDVSPDGGATWDLLVEAHEFSAPGVGEVSRVHPETGEVLVFYAEGEQGKMTRFSPPTGAWSEARDVPFRLRFDNGSLIWLRDRESTGLRRMVAMGPVDNGHVASWYSDDDGRTWQGPSNAIGAPERPGRWRNPAGSPEAVELADGRLWLLTRNSQDHLWESFSEDRGITWSEPGPSRFYGVFSMVVLRRLPDQRLMMVWLNSMPREIEGVASFHNTARDVLHAAISDDDGATWRGFREVMLDRRRHELVYSAEPAYDAGIHHPKFTVTADNKAIVMSGQDDHYAGQNTEHRQAVIFDLDWLYETSRRTDFSRGYDDLNVFKLSKERRAPTNYYSRIHGATLVGHPTEPGRVVLHLAREPNDWVFNEQDGANWNFPAGYRGELRARIMLRPGFRGGSIALTDVFYAPSDNAGDESAMFRFEIPADGRVDERTALAPNVWYTVALRWDGTTDPGRHRARVSIDGKPLEAELPLRNVAPHGISYVRLRSTAEVQDPAGYLVEWMEVDTRSPIGFQPAGPVARGSRRNSPIARSHR